MINTNAQHKLLKYFQDKHTVIVLYLSKAIEQQWIMDSSELYERGNVRESEASPCLPTTETTRPHRFVMIKRFDNRNRAQLGVVISATPANGPRNHAAKEIESSRQTSTNCGKCGAQIVDKHEMPHKNQHDRS